MQQAISIIYNIFYRGTKRDFRTEEGGTKHPVPV
jgi:hypothetical protein